jgi:hypothetical protein
MDLLFPLTMFLVFLKLDYRLCAPLLPGKLAMVLFMTGIALQSVHHCSAYML